MADNKDAVDNKNAINDMFQNQDPSQSNQNLSQKQIEQLQAGNVISLNNMNSPMAEGVDDPQQSQQQQQFQQQQSPENQMQIPEGDLSTGELKELQENLSAAGENGNIDIDQAIALGGGELPETVEEEVSVNVPKVKKKKRIPKAVVGVLAALAGISAGFFGHMFIHDKFLFNTDDVFTLRSAKAIQKSFQVETDTVTVLESYVRNGEKQTECMIYGAVRTDIGDYKNQWFRITESSSEKNVLKVYLEFSQSYYDHLMAGDEKDKLNAAMLKSYAEEMDGSIRQIKEGSGSWVRTDAYAVNEKLIETE